MRAGEDRVEILGPPHDHVRALNVRMTARLSLTRGKAVRLAVRMENWSVGQQRRARIEDGRQLLVCNIDEPRGLLRCLAGFRRNRGNAIADEDHLIEREDRPVREHPAVTLVADVSSGEDGLHTGNGARGGGIDRNDLRMRERARRKRRP